MATTTTTTTTTTNGVKVGDTVYVLDLETYSTNTSTVTMAMPTPFSSRYQTICLDKYDLSASVKLGDKIAEFDHEEMQGFLIFLDADSLHTYLIEELKHLHHCLANIQTGLLLK